MDGKNVVPMLWMAGLTFYPGEWLCCPARIARRHGSEPCGKPIEIKLPPQTRAEVRVVVIGRFHAGEVVVKCKRKSCRAQLAIRFEGVA